MSSAGMLEVVAVHVNKEGAHVILVGRIEDGYRVGDTSAAEGIYARPVTEHHFDLVQGVCGATL